MRSESGAVDGRGSAFGEWLYNSQLLQVDLPPAEHRIERSEYIDEGRMIVTSTCYLEIVEEHVSGQYVCFS